MTILTHDTDAADVHGDGRYEVLIEDTLHPLGVGHLCMMLRGVEKRNARTITSGLHGVFRTDERTREEFLALAHAGPARF